MHFRVKMQWFIVILLLGVMLGAVRCPCPRLEEPLSDRVDPHETEPEGPEGRIGPRYGPALEAVALSNQAFSGAFLAETLGEESMVVSPLSAQLLLGMLLLGARGRSAQEIRSVLDLPEDPELLHRGFRNLQARIRSEHGGGTSVRLASRVFVARGFCVLPSFREAARITFGTDAEELEFGQPGAEKIVNHWAERAAGISHLLHPGSLNTDTRVVLASALSFKGAWRQPFDPADTRLRPFTLPEGTILELPTLFGRGEYSVARGGAASLLELPYKSESLSLVVALPREGHVALAEVQRSLGGGELARLLASAVIIPDLEVLLPKFRLETAICLEQPLRRLGVRSVFGAGADLTGLAPPPESPVEPPIFVDRILQKVAIEVDEQGTEASAASLAGVHVMSLPPRFAVDRPFLFYLVMRAAPGLPPQVLFSGVYAGPQ